jgi:hypothetical protein
MAELRFATQAAPGTVTTGQSWGYFDSTTLQWMSKDVNGAITTYLPAITNASVASVAAGYAADTYLAGSSITVPVAGGFTAKMSYYCLFDMVKTAAGIAAFTINVRMGTLGTTGDASIIALAFAAGTAAIDTGRFEIEATFRTVGSGTSAVLVAQAQCSHNLGATGLVSTGAAGVGVLAAAASAGFNSTTQTIIGLSVNGGASFSGTNNLVQARLVK